MTNKSIILLSGGLDSLVSLGLTKTEYNVSLALTFNYGQNPVEYEIEASRKISDYFGLEHKVIELPFLKDITNNSFVSKEGSKKSDNNKSESTLESVWVPNRNGLFLNIAAAYADAFGYKYIIFGANKSEGQVFPDNTSEFVSGINESFEFSTLKKAKVIAPLIDYDKIDIVRVALEKNIPLELVYSCYGNQQKNCGECESCKHLKSALEANGAYNYIERLF